jgi:hypothetical protein
LSPHGNYGFPIFLAFTAPLTAMPVLIAWIYSQTKSVLLAQLLHASSTGALVIFSPPRVAAAQESLWYAVHAAALWLGVAVIATTCGKDLTLKTSP